MATALLRAGSAVIVLPFVVQGLSRDDLGVWYIFLSLAALATLLDLGFSDTTAQMTGYAWAGVKNLQAIGIEVLTEQSAPNYTILANLEATMRRYYALLALAILFMMLTAGSGWIWLKTDHLSDRTSIRAAWIFFSLATSYNIYGTVWPALLTGINGVREAQQLNVLSLAVNALVTIVAIRLHLGLWALAGGQFLMGVVVRQGGRYYFHNLSGSEYRNCTKACDWKLLQLLWPMAWRGGLVSVGNYLILGANVLICSGYLGLAATASFGLSMQVVNLLMATSLGCLLVKRPLIVQLRAKNRSHDIARLFRSRTRSTLLVYILGAVIVLCLGKLLLRAIHAQTPLISFGELGVLLLICLLEVHHVCYAVLITTENQNPFIIPSLVSGAAVVILSMILTPWMGLWGLVLSLGVVQLCFNNWWPVRRGIQGLHIPTKTYWADFFCFR